MNITTTRKNSRGTHWQSEGPITDEVIISAEVPICYGT